mmetsp:Transcript_49124/g.110461  ORF Transcript_49124/g.110461 Transcript_49124/m.110461 type:complete len:297 (-) Transcript_49124:1142-2032(-)
MHPDEFEGRVALEHVFHFTTEGPCCIIITDAVSVLVDEDGEVDLHAELINRVEGRVVDPRDLLAEQHRGQVVVAAHDFAHRPPHLRVLVVHAPHVGDGREIGRVERGETRREALTLLVAERKPSVSHHLVSVRVDVARRVVVLVVQWLLGAVVAPLFTAGHAKDNCALDLATIHGLERGDGPGRFLQEVEKVEVAIDRFPFLLDPRGKHSLGRGGATVGAFGRRQAVCETGDELVGVLRNHRLFLLHLRSLGIFKLLAQHTHTGLDHSSLGLGVGVAGKVEVVDGRSRAVAEPCGS